MSLNHVETNDTLVCYICGKKFEQLEIFKMHLSDHLFLSEICDIYPFEYFEMEETKNYHSISCKSLHSQVNLTSQTNNTIQNKEIHVCDACGKEFKRKDHLKKHYAVHTGIRPFMCIVCGKSFARKSTLKDHCVIHLSNGWSCYFCGKLFSQRCILRKHQMIHRGVKPFSCELCDREFSRKNDLLRHRTSHTGEKSHFCVVCGKGFSQKRLVKRHLSVHERNLLHTEEKSPFC